MRSLAVDGVIVALAMLAGCSREATLACTPDMRYVAARSAPPVQIPDDLTPPNESDALRLPPEVGAAAPGAAGGCLDAPPAFFGESRPFLRDDESEQRQSESREPSDLPASDGDRVIDN
jgi:hypothetical protein